MITDFLTEKQLALYGILKNFDGYTIDSETLTVSINVELAYNVDDLENKITLLQQEIELLENDQEVNEEYKNLKLENLNDVLEITQILKDKLNGDNL